MKEYYHNTTRHTEYKETRQYFWYAIFMLCLIWGALEQRFQAYQYDSTINESKSVRSYVRHTQGGLFTYEMNDTIIIYKPITHLDPLVGRILKY